MTRRYKGRPRGKTIAREFPFIVEIAVPPGGLGKRLNAMQCTHFTISAAFRWRASGIDMKVTAIIYCGASPAAQLRKSSRPNSAAY